MINSFGTIFKLTSFGESHGKALGGVIDGCPAGVSIDEDFIQQEMDRRRPGQSRLTTARNEPDSVEFLSGIFEGKTTGTPIGFVVYNQNQRSEDYDHLKDVYRPSHADYVYQEKYHNRDYRGGGRSSARETVSRIVAGAIAKLALKQIMQGIDIKAYTAQVGDIALDKPYQAYDLSTIENNVVRCPDAKVAEKMIELVAETKKQGDTIGGVITCVVKGVPLGLGEPVFGKLHALLGSAMLSINAVKGFEYGMGFAGVSSNGSKVNDTFYVDNGVVKTKTNNSGGIQGGISNGQDIYFNVAFKPVATILQEQEVLTRNLEVQVQKVRGRHDSCVLPRAVPIVEAMAAMVIFDAYLMAKVRTL